jgi:hypothetical protein
MTTDKELERDTELALTPTTKEDELDGKRPIPQDRADQEIRASHYRFKRSWNLSTAGLVLVAVILAQALVSQSKKPREKEYWRILPNGEFVQMKNAVLDYDPRPNDAREYLERWATYRYRRLRDSIGKDFAKNYWFMERQLGQQVMAHDEKANLVANVISGRTPENDVENVHADILSFETRTVDGQPVGQGEALIDLTLIYPALLREPHPRRVHLRVGVAFLINPAQVQEKSYLWPEYGKVNGAGLTLLKVPLENSVPIPEAAATK